MHIAVVEKIQSEETILLNCLKYYFQTLSLQHLSRQLGTKFCWQTLLKTAIDKGVMPLLYQVVQQLDPDLIPASVRLQLKKFHRMNGLQNISQTQELLNVLAKLEAAGIDAIAFKGSGLAVAAYGSVAARQFNDMDILVRQQDFWQAKAVLEAQHYYSPVSQALEIQSFDRHLQINLFYEAPDAVMFNRQFQASMLYSNAERRIDLHWGIPPRRLWRPDRFERIWQQHQISLDLMGQSVKTLTPEAALMVQCVNLAKEPGTRSLKQACDAAQIIQANPDLDWQTVLQLASELRHQELVLRGLAITQACLGIDLPEWILTRQVRFEPATSDALLSVLWRDYVHQIRTLDRRRDMPFISAIHLQWLLKMAFLPHQSDLDTWRLPSQLSVLLYLLRPLRILYNHLRMQ